MTTCPVRHRTWAARARCEWPWAAWVHGEGRWASVRTRRRGTTVLLFPTRVAAQEAACIEPGCRVVDLAWPHRPGGAARAGERLSTSDRLAADDGQRATDLPSWGERGVKDLPEGFDPVQTAPRCDGMGPDRFENPDRWSDEDYDLSELSPEEWPRWALGQLGAEGGVQ